MNANAVYAALVVLSGVATMSLSATAAPATAAPIMLAAADENGVALDDGKRPHTQLQHSGLVEAKARSDKASGGTQAKPPLESADPVPLSDGKRPHTTATHKELTAEYAMKTPTATPIQAADPVPLGDGKRPHTAAKHKDMQEAAQNK